MTKIDGHKVHDVSFNDVLEIMRAHGYEDVNALSRVPDNPIQWKQDDWELIFDLAARCMHKKITEAKRLDGTTLLKILGHCLRSSRIYDMIRLLWQEQTAIASIGAQAFTDPLTGPGGEVRGQP